jgi:hypothetical protein
VGYARKLRNPPKNDHYHGGRRPWDRSIDGAGEGEEEEDGFANRIDGLTWAIAGLGIVCAHPFASPRGRGNSRLRLGLPPAAQPI